MGQPTSGEQGRDQLHQLAAQRGALRRGTVSTWSTDSQQLEDLQLEERRRTTSRVSTHVQQPIDKQLSSIVPVSP
jgi:hypothetical protein